MKSLKSKIAILFLIGITFPSEPDAIDFRTGAVAGVGSSIILSRPSATGLVELPGLRIVDGYIALETGYERRFRMSELEEVFVAAAYQRSNISLAFGLSQFGHTDFYAERTGKLSLAWFFNSVAVGGSISGREVNTGIKQDPLNTYAFGFSLSWRHDNYYLAMEIDDINRPKLHDSALPYNRKYDFYAELSGKQAFSLLLRASLEETEKPDFTLGQLFDVSEQGSLFWFVTTEPLEYGGGIRTNFSGVSSAYSVSYHPILDLSHSISFAYTFGDSN